MCFNPTLKYFLFFFSTAFFQLAAQNTATGSYSGDGNATHAITGLGFQPAAVIVKSAGADYAYIKTSTMGGNNSKNMYSTTNLETDKILSLDANGFTVGNTSAVNTNGTVYYFVAFKTSSTMYAGSYTGADADRKIPGSGFRAKYTIVCPADARSCYHVFNTAGNGTSYNFNSFNEPYNSSATAGTVVNDGFYVSPSGGNFNIGGITYHYVSWDWAAGEDTTSTYNANQADGYAVTTSSGGTQFRPQFIITKQGCTCNSTAMCFGAQSGDNTLNARNLASYAGGIKSITSTGFTIGTDTTVNRSSGNPYRWFAIGGTNAVSLPIELVSFSAKVEGKSIRLLWQTASELNNDYFTIERTLDGTEFEEVAKVKGAGSSNYMRDYSVYDTRPAVGTAYYRLKQTDYDGKFTYSNLIVVEMVNPSPFSVFPNPAHHNITIKFPDLNQSFTVKIKDMYGKVMQEEKVLIGDYARDAHDKTLDVSRLEYGVYLLLLESETTKISMKITLQ